MQNIGKRLSVVERQAAKLQMVSVSYIGRHKGATALDLLQAVQLLLAKKAYRIELQMTPEESQATLSETAIMIENYIKEKKEAWQ